MSRNQNGFNAPAVRETGMEFKHTALSAATDADVARAMAQVQGQVFMAKQFPRDMTRVYARLMAMAGRPSLAAVAFYSYPRGKGEDGKSNLVTGLSIRAAEAIAQEFGNIDTGYSELDRSPDGESLVETYCWDLETNYRKTIRFKMRHVRETKSGAYSLKGERDINELMSNQAQRRVRQCILAVIPGDILDDLKAQFKKTSEEATKVTKELLLEMLAGFEKVGVTREMLERRHGRPWDKTTASQIVELRSIYASIRDGVGSPADYFGEDETPGETVACAECAAEIDAKTWATMARRHKLPKDRPLCVGHIAQRDAKPGNEPKADPETKPTTAEPPADVESEADLSKLLDLRAMIEDAATDFGPDQHETLRIYCQKQHGKKFNDLLKSGSLEETTALFEFLKGVR